MEKLKNLMPYYEKDRVMAYQCIMYFKRCFHHLIQEYDLHNLTINSSLSLSEQNLTLERIWLEFHRNEPHKVYQCLLKIFESHEVAAANNKKDDLALYHQYMDAFMDELLTFVERSREKIKLLSLNQLLEPEKKKFHKIFDANELIITLYHYLNDKWREYKQKYPIKSQKLVFYMRNIQLLIVSLIFESENDSDKEKFNNMIYPIIVDIKSKLEVDQIVKFSKWISFENQKLLFLKVYDLYKKYIDGFNDMGKELDNNYRLKIFKRIKRISQQLLIPNFKQKLNLRDIDVINEIMWMFDEG